MGINLEIVMFLYLKMNAVKMIIKNVWTCRTLILLTLIFFMARTSRKMDVITRVIMP